MNNKEYLQYNKIDLHSQEKLKIDPDILSEAEIVAQVVGGDFEMTVKIGEPGHGSFQNLETANITLDPLQFIKKDNPRYKNMMNEFTEKKAKIADIFPKYFPEIKKEDLDMDKLIFLLGHEAGHRAITCGPHEIGLRDDKIEELERKIGFFYGSNAVEDPADNNWIKKKFSKIGDSMKKFYNQQTSIENIPMGIEHPDVQRAIISLGYVPRFTWFGAEVIRYWWKKQFSKGLKPEIEESVKKVKDYLPKIFNAIPPEKVNKRKKIEFGRKRFIKYYQKVWPELEKLVKMDIDDEKINQMIKKMKDKVVKQLEDEFKKELEKQIQQKQEQKSQNQQKQNEVEKQEKQRQKQRQKEQEKQIQKQINERQIKIKSLRKKINDLKKKAQNASPQEKQELEEQIKRHQTEKQKNDQKIKDFQQKLEQIEKQEQVQQQKEQLQKQNQELDKQIEEMKKKMENASPQEKQELEEQIKRKEEQKSQNQQKQNEIEKQEKQRQKYPTSPLEGLSSGLKKKLKEIYDQLSEEEKKELEKIAKKNLEDLEDELNSELRGKLNKDNPRLHQEIRKEEENKTDKLKEKENNNDQEDIQKAYEETKKEISDKLKNEITEYERAYSEVKPIIEKLYQKLKKIFEPLEGEWEEGYAAGQRMNMRKAMQAKARPELKTKIWEKRRKPEELKYRFILLVDTSYSMIEDKKIEETFKGLVVLTEVLNKLDIPVEIIAFSTYIKKFKDFKQKLNAKLRNKLSEIKSYDNDDTYTSEATLYAWEELKKNMKEDEDVFLITLTDGEANGFYAEILPDIINEIAQHKIKQIGIGLGEETKFVKEIYPASLYLPKIKLTEKEKNKGQKGFEELMAELLEQMIRHPEKFTSKGKFNLNNLIK